MVTPVTSVILKRDRFVILAGLAIITALSWAYMLLLAADMNGMDMSMVAMSHIQPWQTADWLFTFIMWTVMMVAMMTPSASPMVLIFARINRQRWAKKQPIVPATVFLLGYLLAWVGFSLVATLLQWGLHAAALLSPMMVMTSPVLGGITLLVAGVFQFTPLKHVCLAHCRTPMGFILTEWRDGWRGALVMGLQHGRFCLGCCWFLMAILFVAGVMNLLWVATIAAFVLIEKVAPAGEWVSRLAGLVLIGWGIWLIFGTLISQGV